MAQSTARSSRPSTSLDRAPAKARKAVSAAAKVALAKEPRKEKTKPPLTTVKGGKSGGKSARAGATMSKSSATRAAASAKTESAPVKPIKEEKKSTPIVSKGYVPLVNIPKPPPPPANFTLHVGDKAVHPSHGLAEVTAIEHREIGSIKGEFYILKIVDNGMRVMVPRTLGGSSGSAGIRPVMSAKEADRVLDTMRAREVAVDLQPWSRRFRAYTEMIKSGAPHEVAKVLRDMYRLKFDKDLSFGERRLLDQAKSLLMKELAAAKGTTEVALQAKVDDMFRV
ncbi:MAG: hypothetical protein FWD73_01885 [Polyangiaceae bacterium]|nr:hypothetical protein [Polyangiaceae bacterium]